MIYYLAPMAFTPKSEQLAQLSCPHAFVVPLQSFPGCDERGKNTLVIAFLSAFPTHSFQTQQFWQATFQQASDEVIFNVPVIKKWKQCSGLVFVYALMLARG